MMRVPSNSSIITAAPEMVTVPYSSSRSGAVVRWLVMLAGFLGRLRELLVALHGRVGPGV